MGHSVIGGCFSTTTRLFRSCELVGQQLSDATASVAVVSAVIARGLVKRYGAHTAVAGIDLTIPSGGCYGILWPNGAGQTTTMKMVTCVSPPTDGALAVLAGDVRGD